jgi:hypothetical protein
MSARGRLAQILDVVEPPWPKEYPFSKPAWILRRERRFDHVGLCMSIFTILASAVLLDRITTIVMISAFLVAFPVHVLTFYVTRRRSARLLVGLAAGGITALVYRPAPEALLVGVFVFSNVASGAVQARRLASLVRGESTSRKG